jgi:hypothetical protein
MAPKAKDVAWVHVEVIEGLMYFKYLKKCIKGGGGIQRMKEHLDGVRGQVKSCEAPLDVIGPIREEMQKVLNDYQEEKAREKAIHSEIGRKRAVEQMRATNPTFDYEDSPSIHSTGVRNRDPFHYVPPSLECENTMHPPKSKKKNTIQRYFTPPSTSGSDNANVSQVQPTQFQPTLDDHWKKQYREIAYEYIARWWYHVDIPFNVVCSPYYQPMWDAIIACGRGFKVPSMHYLKGSLLHCNVPNPI